MTKCNGDCVFCPYKEICSNGDNLIAYKMIYNGAYLFIQGELSPLLLKGLDKEFSYELPSAHFIKQATNNSKY